MESVNAQAIQQSGERPKRERKMKITREKITILKNEKQIWMQDKKPAGGF